MEEETSACCGCNPMRSTPGRLPTDAAPIHPPSVHLPGAAMQPPELAVQTRPLQVAGQQASSATVGHLMVWDMSAGSSACSGADEGLLGAAHPAAAGGYGRDQPAAPAGSHQLREPGGALNLTCSCSAVVQDRCLAWRDGCRGSAAVLSNQRLQQNVRQSFLHKSGLSSPIRWAVECKASPTVVWVEGMACNCSK